LPKKKPKLPLYTKDPNLEGLIFPKPKFVPPGDPNLGIRPSKGLGLNKKLGKF